MARSLALGACSIATAVAILRYNTKPAKAHCQVPCGIYDDGARINGMIEDVNTIRKATQQINTISKTRMDALGFNQSTRWVATKEQHASSIITTISEYFLTQKLKDLDPSDPNYNSYLQTLALHHKVLRSAMTTKQSVDETNVDKLQNLVEELGVIWGVPKQEEGGSHHNH